MGNSRLYGANVGTVLLLTLMMLVLLTFEVAMVSLVAQRGLGEEGMLLGQNISGRRGAEVVLNRLEEKLYNDLRTKSAASLDATYVYNGADAIAEQDLMITNPSTGAQEATDVKITGWVKERRGYWYHLIGRARVGTVDLLAHRWVKINPCSVASTLSTILTGVKDPGLRAGIAVDSNGRAFIGQFATSAENGGATMWTWQRTTGLSTILTGFDKPLSMETWEDYWGWGKRYAIDNTNRIVFGNYDAGRVWSWHAGTGLSTIVNMPAEDFRVASDGRYYFGGSWGSNFYSWKLGVGLSTIASNVSGAGGRPIDGPVLPTRLFFTLPGNATTQKSMYLWDSSTGLSTVMHDTWTTGIANDLDSINGTNNTLTDVFVAEDWNDTSGTLLRWNATTGLSTIISENCYGCGDFQMLPDGTMWFGGYNPQYLWSAANGLSTLANDSNDYDLEPGMQQANYSYGTQMLWWDRTGGGIGTFTTMHSAGFNMGYDGQLTFDRVSKRTFFGSDHTTNSRFYTWTSTTGLSTIVGSTSGKNKAGYYSTRMDQANRDMVYFGADGATASMNVWSPQYGLSTIVSGRPYPGVDNITSSPTGGVYFGEQGASVNFYFWEPPPNCDNLGY